MTTGNQSFVTSTIILTQVGNSYFHYHAVTDLAASLLGLGRLVAVMVATLVVSGLMLWTMAGVNVLKVEWGSHKILS